MLKLNQILKILTITACFCLAFALPTLTHARSPMPGMPSMLQIKQVQLTEQNAMNVFDSYLEMKTKFADDQMPRTNDFEYGPKIIQAKN